jgi:hypothetical protein
MRANKKQILDLIYDNPVKIGQWVGFKDLTELHNKWLKLFLWSTDDLTLQGHRGSYKTTTLALFFALHIIIKPNETMLFFRKTGSDVSEVLRTTSNILHSGCIQEIVRTIYGCELILTTDTNGAIHTNLATKTAGAFQLTGLGIGTSITGKHADIVITDDIVNVKDRVSGAERENTKIAYQELQNIKNRGGRFINTGTPWHKDDAFQLMPNPLKFDCYSTGLMSQSEIDALKESMAPSLFAANYELKHIAAEDVIFENPILDGTIEMCKNGIVHVDSAFYGSDYTAFTCVKLVDGKLYVLGKLWRKHVEDCYQDIYDLYTQVLGGKLYMEKNADKGMVARDLKQMGIRTVPYDESTNKYIKIVTYAKKVWKDIRFVDGTDDEYIEQICDYTETAAHDDAPDSLASAIRVIYPKIGREEYKPMIYV